MKEPGEEIVEPSSDAEMKEPVEENVKSVSSTNQDITTALETVVDYLSSKIADKVSQNISQTSSEQSGQQNGFDSNAITANTFDNSGGGRKKTRKYKLIKKKKTRQHRK